MSVKKKKEPSPMQELNLALTLLEKEKGISREFIYEALENALLHSYKKNYKEDRDNTVVRIDRETGDIKVIASRIAVENIGDIAECNEMLISEARLIKADVQVGDTVEVEILPRDFGRIAAQTAKNIILQKIREAERENILKEFDMKNGDIISGRVDRVERVDFKRNENSEADSKPKYNVIFDIGKTDVILGSKGQIPGETYVHGQKMLLFVSEISNTAKGPFIQVTRTAPEFVAKLFEREVPEIQDGTVEIKSVSREAGSRTKIAVHSNDENVEAVGACVGNKSSRVNAVVEALSGEKIEIIKYSEQPEEYISAAIAPAQAKDVVVDYNALDEGRKEAVVIVDETQLSLAIGKLGVNAKLAARLTGWKIDIKSDAQYAAETAGTTTGMSDALEGIDEALFSDNNTEE